MRQKGVAVIMVLLVLAIVAITTAALIKRHQFSQTMTSQLVHLGQTKAHIQGAQLWAAQMLTTDRQSNKVDHLGESWAQLTLPMPVEQGFVSGYITDLQGQFNLNSLVADNQVNEAAMGLFKRLLEQQKLNPQLSWYLVDWIDRNVETEQQNTLEDAFYLGQAVPYRSANQALVDISELGLVRGFDQATVAMLMPFVSALPQPTKINVNSASIDVLMALSNTIDINQAEQLIINRNDRYWRTSSAFIEAVLGPKDSENQHQWSALAELVTVDSHYFKLNVAAQFDVAKIQLESNLHRGNNGQVTVLSKIYTP